VARGTFVRHHDLVQPAPAPRFSRTSAALRSARRGAGHDTDDVLDDHGYGVDEIAELRGIGAAR
jgi:alpha-methylacyl-CoA racemase